VKSKDVERLKEIIKLADKLKWIYPPSGTSYPLMQLSEVEKCMLAMTDDFELDRMRKWVEDQDKTPCVPSSDGSLTLLDGRTVNKANP